MSPLRTASDKNSSTSPRILCDMMLFDASHRGPAKADRTTTLSPPPLWWKH